MLTVNLTTTLQRVDVCRIALLSLGLQSQRPDRINLWVSKEPYLRDKGISNDGVIEQLMQSLPGGVQELVSVRWVANTGPYRKLIPVLREAGGEDVIVTADDDIFYGRTWLEKLMKAYAKADGAPVAARVRFKKINALGKTTSYIYWKLVDKPAVLQGGYVVTFGGGAVLTRSMFREEDIDSEAYLELAPAADDLWYSKLLQLNNPMLVVVPEVRSELSFIKHDDGLKKDNLPKKKGWVRKIQPRVWNKLAGLLGFSVCGNDVAYKNIEKHFSKG